MTTTFERRIALAGASNIRDLGGYRTADGESTRWRRVFRADALQDLTSEDVAAIMDLRVGDVFDLRTQKEIEVFGTNPLTAHGVRHHHVPFHPQVGTERTEDQAATVPAFDDFAAFAQLYMGMLETAGPALARIFTHLAEEPEEAIVFHCTGGRDRTGMTAALLLGILGVPRETIEADYALTGQYLIMPESRLEKMRQMYGDRMSLRPSGPLPTPGEVIVLALEGLDERYGSPEAYLEQHGVTAEHREALRRSLLDAS
jgi:protein-tyrosine phosphatase